MRALRSILIVLASTACVRGTLSSLHTAEYPDKDIYAAVIDRLVTEADIRSRPVLGDSTSSSVFEANYVMSRHATRVGLVADLFKKLDRLDSSTVRNFEDRNVSRVEIPKLPASLASVGRVKTSTLESLPRDFNARWRAFFELFPGSSGLISFSAIGYSHSGEEAILMADHHCGGLCGRGYLIGLRKKADKWYIVFFQTAWIS